MADEKQLPLRRKYTFHAHGKKVVFFKKAMEHERHVVMKALLWALYLPQYPGVAVEVPAGGNSSPEDSVRLFIKTGGVVEMDESLFARMAI